MIIAKFHLRTYPSLVILSALRLQQDLPGQDEMEASFPGPPILDMFRAMTCYVMTFRPTPLLCIYSV